MSRVSGEIGAPEKLSAEHDLAGFDSGEPALDEWLRRRALPNEASGASRTYVVCAGKKVVGYYTLAVGAVAHADAPGRVKRNTPDPVPAMVLGRLAVDRAFQGRHIGAGLLRDAVLRTVQAAEIAGIRAILVHAISEAAKRFYEGYGFIGSPVDPLTVMITIAEAVKVGGARTRSKALRSPTGIFPAGRSSGLSRGRERPSRRARG
jgi:GNAT superfamily N-acetyltransferase